MREHDYMDWANLKEHLISLGYTKVNQKTKRIITNLVNEGKVHTLKGTEWINKYNKAGGDPELPELPYSHDMKKPTYKVADVLSNLPK